MSSASDQSSAGFTPLIKVNNKPIEAQEIKEEIEATKLQLDAANSKIISLQNQLMEEKLKSSQVLRCTENFSEEIQKLLQANYTATQLSSQSNGLKVTTRTADGPSASSMIRSRPCSQQKSRDVGESSNCLNSVREETSESSESSKSTPKAPNRGKSCKLAITRVEARPSMLEQYKTMFQPNDESTSSKAAKQKKTPKKVSPRGPSGRPKRILSSLAKPKMNERSRREK